MRDNNRDFTNAAQLTALVTVDGLTDGFLKDSQAGTFGLARLGDAALADAQAAILTGTTTNDDAAAGKFGEPKIAEVLFADRVDVPSATPTDITSLSLTAGDWLAWGQVNFAPVSTCVPTAIIAWLNDTATTLPTKPAKGAIQHITAPFATSAQQSLFAGVRRFSLASTTTIYLGCQATFTVEAMKAYGMIGAFRVR